MTRTLAQVEDEIRRSRNAMDASTLSGRSRTDALIAEADRLRNGSQGATVYSPRLGAFVPPNGPRTIAAIVREALRRTDDAVMIVAGVKASDEACVALYRMLNL